LNSFLFGCKASFTKLSALTWGGAALSLVLSCSSREEDSTGFSAAVDFCQRWVDTAAVASARCLGASEAAVRMLVAQLNVCLDVSASLATFHLKYDPRFADACLAETPALACSQGLPASTACNKVFVGEVAVGGACSPLAFDNVSECVMAAGAGRQRYAPAAAFRWPSSVRHVRRPRASLATSTLRAIQRARCA
jgi:hypothetical protein